MSTQKEVYHHSDRARSARSPTSEPAVGSFALGQVSIAPNAPLHPRPPTIPYDADGSTRVSPSAWVSSASAPRVRGSYGSHQEPADRYASPFPRTQYAYAQYSAGTYPAASPSDVSSGSAWDPYATSTASMPGPSPVIPAYAPGYEAYLPAPLTPYSNSYSYGTGDPSGSYYYGPTPAYEPRNSSSTATFTNAMLSSSEHFAPSGSSSSANESTAGAHEYPSTIKKKRKRANADQLSVLNEVYDQNPFPPTVQREQLAQQLGMTPRSVQIWFQNKRQAARQGGRGGQAPKPSSTANGHSGQTASTRDRASAESGSSAVQVSAPSAAAPRGAPGYVASPTLRAQTTSSVRAEATSSNPQTIAVEPYSLRRSHTTEREDDLSSQSRSATRRRR